jgi:hypothetical protein
MGINARFTYAAPPATSALRTKTGGREAKPYSSRMRSGKSAIVMKFTVSTRGRAVQGTRALARPVVDVEPVALQHLVSVSVEPREPLGHVRLA